LNSVKFAAVYRIHGHSTLKGFAADNRTEVPNGGEKLDDVPSGAHTLIKLPVKSRG
jgi:hypothetical protein